MLLRSGDMHAAIEHYRQALAQDPDSPDVRYNRAQKQIGDWAEVIRHDQRAAEIDPEHPPARRLAELE